MLNRVAVSVMRAWFPAQYRSSRKGRVVSWAAVLLMVTLLVSGCVPTGLLAPQERQIVVLWHSFSGAEAAALASLTDRFNLENEWQIVLITEYQEKLLDKLQAAPDRRPDLVTVWPKELQTYVALDMVGAVPLDASEVRMVWDDVLPMARALYELDGTVHALPLGLATYLAYFNQEWLADLGYAPEVVDWEDFLRTTCAATDPRRGQVGVGAPAKASVLLAFLTAGGSEVIGPDGYYRFSDPAGRAAATALQSVMAGGCGVVYEDWDAGVSRLSRSSMAMILESSQHLSEIERAVLAGRNFSLGISPMPGAEGPGPTLWYGPGLLVSAPVGTRQDAALQVLSWFLSSEVQVYWGVGTSYVPARRSAIEAQLRDEDTTVMVTAMTGLWQLTLAAADSGAWLAWPQPSDRITCRAALLRSLLALQQKDTDTNAYLATAVTECNTGVGLRLTPQPVEAVTP